MMKKICYSLFFLFISIQLFSQETEKLPKIPWEEIVEINNNELYKIAKWNTNIYIELVGNYNKQDSIEVDRIIRKYDSITKTITIKFATDNKANFKINYLDKYQYSKYDPGRELTNSISKDYKGNIRKFEIRLYLVDQTNAEIRKTLEFNIANGLVFGNFPSYFGNVKRNSIFNAYNNKKNKKKPLNAKDLEIIKEVYKKGFIKRLQKAEIQFRNSTIKNLEKYKIDLKHWNLWWVRSPLAVIILPLLLSILFVIYVLGKLKKIISTKIKKDWLQFGILVIVLLFFTDIIIILSVSSIDFLKIPDDYTKVPFVRYDTVFTTIMMSLISIPILFLFRFIESKIQVKTNSILIKTGLIFISTGFLPFIFLCTMFLIGFPEGQNKQGGYTTLANIFVGLMIIATIRSLVSYFIFKEKKLILDNELKLSNLRELKTKAELKSLQAQINPHFLYNSLNSIASLAPIDAVKTQKMAHSLSDLFKYSINRKNENIGFIKDEIEMVKTYLEIEKIRFGDHLQFTIDVDSTLENHKIPLFLIQPLVENAVKHGISKNIKEGQIDINIKKKNNEICISVSDNGPNFPEGLFSGHGLQTVYDLLRLNYKGKASLNWTNTPQKKIIITIPETL